MEEKCIQSQTEIPQIFSPFGAIRYIRGSSIVAMVVDMIDLDTFLDGMNTYLMEKAYSTAITDELWNYLDAKTRASVFFADKPKLTLP